MKSHADDRYLQGRRALERVLQDAQRDRHAAQRLFDAIQQHRRHPGRDGAYRELGDFAEFVVRECARFIQQVQRGLTDRGEEAWIHTEHVDQLRLHRRELRRILRCLPASLTHGVPVTETESDRVAIARIERKPMPAAPHLEHALLTLPTPWLRSMRNRHRIRTHRARDRLTASIADAIHLEGDLAERLAEIGDAADMLRLARLVACGRVRLRALTPRDREDLKVPLDWNLSAPGFGGRARQLGVLFVGRASDESVVYVPDGARPVLAHTLLPSVEDLLSGAPSEIGRDVLNVLVELAAQEERRRDREQPIPDDPTAWEGHVPTRLSRIQRKTPGPDRIYELESRLIGSPEPMRRRIMISYRRTVGALRETMDLAAALRPRWAYISAAGSTRTSDAAWVHPAGLREGERDEWATSIRDLFTKFGERFAYHAHLGAGPGPSDCHVHEIRLVRIHAPEYVAMEPWIPYGEGMAPYATEHGAGPLQASLDAANGLLERVRA